MFLAAQKYLIISGALMGFLSVAAGAFGAHALKHRLTPESLAIFEVAARYQMYHALALVLCSCLIPSLPGFFLPIAGLLFFFGTILFSGSLYILAITGIRWLGMITPIGGIILLVGWLFLMLGVASSK